MLSPAPALARQSPTRPLPARRTPEPLGAPRSPPQPRLPPALPRRCRRASPNSAQVRTAPPRSAPHKLFPPPQGERVRPQARRAAEEPAGGSGHRSPLGSRYRPWRREFADGSPRTAAAQAPPAHPPALTLSCAALRCAPARGRSAGHGKKRDGDKDGRPRHSPAAPTAAGGGSGTRPEQAGQAAPRPRPPRSRGTRVTPARRGGEGFIFFFFPFSSSSRVNWRGLSVVKTSASGKGGKPRRAGLF